ncbi:hypothetical protein [Cellulomonas denverensis]|uniref:Uncharacterized protein n=1 Tax=Cellulomonas denverensis TaxID=264297 RepID=A0A7X6KTW4_9CELL|nr:hypothetical protein [Cellulomonas denverensis]NKY22184.1 hypothetical protein [Cellulomonas denverensis]GIG27147.1 hypothetical protein Cde04nite_33910 [Cellulomonas denverensis]
MSAPITEWLDAAQETAADATPGPWGYDIRISGAAWVNTPGTRLPRAIAALRAVLELHVPGTALGVAVCMTCSQVKTDDEWDDPLDAPIPSWLPFPCPTVRAIATALGVQP